MLDDVAFPSADKMRDGFWQPVYFSPNFESSERLIVAVVANVEDRWEIAIRQLKLDIERYNKELLDFNLQVPPTIGQRVPLNISIIETALKAAESEN